MKIKRLFTIYILVLLSVFVSSVRADHLFQPPSTTQGRYVAFISDLHIGIGKINGRWHPYEDFRWPRALQGLLDHLNTEGKGAVDLIIVGDFLELWQRPDYLGKCRNNSKNENNGCSIEQMAKMIEAVLSSRQSLLEKLAIFSQTGDNRLYIIPGNHDSALLIPSLWRPLADLLNTKSGRVKLITNGVYTSPDGRIVVEHGHQIHGDSNRYEQWPNVLGENSTFIQKPFGEQFVQKLFNDVEQEYPIVDNLSPEVAGVWYRMQDKGAWRSVGDFWRFLGFYLFETSWHQKGQFLGDDENPGDPESVAWDIKKSRKLGYTLFARALPESDPIRSYLLSETPDEDILSMRNNLTHLATDQIELVDEQVAELCDLVELHSTDKCPTDQDGTLGELARKIPGVRPWLMRNHLEKRREQNPDMLFFIYGHTHQLEEGHPVKLSTTKTVYVFNTGAFQRLLNRQQYLARLPDGMSAADGLSQLDPEKHFPPCYTFVAAPWTGTRNQPKTWRWHMPEFGVGTKVKPGDQLCE